MMQQTDYALIPIIVTSSKKKQVQTRLFFFSLSVSNEFAIQPLLNMRESFNERLLVARFYPLSNLFSLVSAVTRGALEFLFVRRSLVSAISVISQTINNLEGSGSRDENCRGHSVINASRDQNTLADCSSLISQKKKKINLYTREQTDKIKLSEEEVG